MPAFFVLMTEKARIYSSTNRQGGVDQMKKMSKLQSFLLSLVIVGICGAGYYYYGDFPGLQTKETIQVVQEDTHNQTGVKEGYVRRDLYLIDENGYVVPQAVELPASNSVIQQSLEYLVQNGPVSNLLPNGFKATLPADTEMTVDLQEDGTLVVDLSSNFKNYEATEEPKILQSLVWTATQFERVKNVQLRLQGRELSAMPVAGLPIVKNLNRSIGINLQTSDVADLANSKSIVVYYLSQIDKQVYYVPVTKRVHANEANMAKVAVQELIQGPSYHTNLLSDFREDAALLSDPQIVDGLVTLDFNINILEDTDAKIISPYTLNALVLSLTEQPEIESVAFLINGDALAVDSNGKVIDSPISRPENTNVSSYE